MAEFGIMMQGLTMEQILEKEGDRYLPLLQYILRKSDPDFTFPGDTDERIGSLRLAILARNVFLFNELKELLNACGGAGIETILLKGAMMEGIYPAGLRPFTDIDFLIRREKLAQVEEILGSLGYRSRIRELRHGTEDFQGEVGYLKNGRMTIFIEPHWLLGPPYPYAGRVDMDSLWRRSREANVAGIDTLILSPEDSLLHFCIHFFTHRYGGWLASSCDIAELALHYEGKLDWQAFLSRVFEFRLCLPVRYSLQETVQLFHPPVPDFVLSELDSYRPARVEQLFFTLLISPGDEESLGGQQLLAQLVFMPGAKLKLRRLLILLFPSGEFMISRYAVTRPRLLPIYYFLHWKNAFVIAIKALFSIAQNMSGMSHSKLRN
jgi:hypothetical protein